MIIKYIALIFGAMFEIYCINTFATQEPKPLESVQQM